MDDYYEAIKGKTAALMASSCRVGALTSGASEERADALDAYGEAIGLVFQLRDDILDITAVDGQLGKPAGQDLAEGIYTYPVLVALAEPTIGPRLSEILGSPLDDDQREDARLLVAQSDGIAAAMSAALGHVDEAVAATEGFGSARLQQGFSDLARSLLVGLPEA